jgi:predicted dehydrogenase
MKGVEIAGFYGRHEGRARKTAKAFGAVATTNVNRILKDDTIEAVDVVVPSGVHRSFVVDALECGKHVFCETPLALTLRDADAMIRTARRAHRLLLVAQLMRFVPDYVFARDVARSGRLGWAILGIASRLSRPYWSKVAPRPFGTYGEPIVELMIFDFNYLNWVFGLPSRLAAHGLVGARGVADYVLTTLHYPRALGFVEGSARMPESFPFSTRLRLQFEKGLIESYFRLKPGGFSDSCVEFSHEGQGRRARVTGGDPYRAECRHFVSCVLGKADPSRIDAVHDRNALRVALAAREAFATGRPVTLTW